MELKNNLAIDFDTFSNSLTNIILADSQTFASIYPGSTSKILIDILAGYASMLMYRLQAAVSNSYLQTAFSEESILAASEMLGVQLRGNIGSSVDLTLSREELPENGYPEIDIPVYTNFEINGLNFYNRVVYTFPASYTRLHMTLYQGEVHKKEFTTTGALNERFEFGVDFTTDLNFVTVFVNGQAWKTDRETILDYATNERYDSTSNNVVLLKMDPSGVSYIQFGNGLYGTVPMSGSSVVIYYASCEGNKGNFSVSDGIRLKDNIVYNGEMLSVYSEYIGTASGGSNRVEASTLKYISPRIFAANNRMVKRNDYIGLLMEYSGYKDVNVWGEFEESKKKGYADNSMMNIAYYTAVLGDFSVKKVALVEGDGETTIFKSDEDCGVNVSNVNEFPGSVLVEYRHAWIDEESGKEEVESETFMDYSGNGYLLSDSPEHTVATYTAPTSVSVDADTQDHPISNTTMRVVDGRVVNTDVYFEASRQPSSSAPLMIEFDLPSSVEDPDTGEMTTDVVLSGIRMLSTSFTSADDRAFPSKVMVIATRSESPKKPLWSYLRSSACTIDMFAQVNSVTVSWTDRDLNNLVKEEYSATASTGESAIIRPISTYVGTELSAGSVLPCEIFFPPSAVSHVTNIVVTGFIRDYYTFPELMHDSEWEVISRVNNIKDPGPISWSDWIGMDTVSPTKKIITYEDGKVISKELSHVYKHYRFIILGQHGSSKTQTTKINKISFLLKNNSSTVDYETGEAVLRFLKPPVEGEIVTATTIGDKISDYQYLVDYAYMRKMNHFTTEINYQIPRIKRVNLDIRVVYSTDADLTVVRNEVENSIKDLFTLGPGFIGESMRLSSIYAAVMRVDGVRYCIINSPSSDIEVEIDEVLYLTEFSVEYQSSARII